MSRRNSIILALLFVILVVEILILAPGELGLSPAEDQAATKSGTKSSAQPEADSTGQVMRDAYLIGASGSEKDWELWAKKGIRLKESENWTIDQVTVKFYANNGVTYTVKGKKGFVVPSEADKSDIRIEGDVETRSSNGYTFKTQSALYKSKERKLTSPHAVEMAGPQESKERNIRLTGSELVADFVSNEISVNRNVKARKKVGTVEGDDKVATIQSQRAVFSGKSNLAQFFGNVVIDVDTMQISGPQAKFAFDPKTDGLDSMQVAGGVRMTDTDRFATSGSVNLFLREDKVVFSGSPRVVQNGDEVVGDQIVFMDGGKKVEVSNAKAQFDPKAMEKRN